MKVSRADIDAVLALVRHRAGTLQHAAIDSDRLGAAGIVAFASAHFVLPALASSASALQVELPDDLGAFLSAMESENRARNARLRDGLARLAGALNAIGVVPLVLKGAAFLADPDRRDPDAEWRFMADIDLMVDEAALGDCVAAARGLGFTPVDATYDARRDAHYPPLISPCGSYSVELHTRLFAMHALATAPDTMRARAAQIRCGEGRLLLPAPCHRVAHLIAHAQIHNRFHALRRIVLRDMLDLAALLAAHAGAIDWSEVPADFQSPHDRRAALSFLAAWQRLTGRPLPVAIGRRSEAWAGAALARLYRPRWQRSLLHAGDMLRLEGVRLLHEPGHLARRLGLLRPGRLAQVRALSRHKLAQKLWA